MDKEPTDAFLRLTQLAFCFFVLFLVLQSETWETKTPKSVDDDPPPPEIEKKEVKQKLRFKGFDGLVTSCATPVSLFQ